MSPTIRSPTMSGSPLGSAHNSDTENDSRPAGNHDAICSRSIANHYDRFVDGPTFNTSSPVLRHRMAHKIQHKFVFVGHRFVGRY